VARLVRLGAVVTALAALVAGLVTGSAGAASAVAWGTLVATPATSVPWVLPLYKTDGPYPPGKAVCTVTAIAPQVVVTAAACMAAPGFYSVGVAGNRLSQGSLIQVEAVMPDPQFSATTHLHDLAVLRPLRPLGLSSYARVAPASVTRRLSGSPGPLMTLYGWGRNEDASSTTRLREGLVLTQDAVAAKTYPRFRPGPMLAAGRSRPGLHGYTRACGIDEGGPLVIRAGGIPYLVGVTSWGAARCTAHLPTVFTAVASHRTWLHDAAAALPARAASRNRAVPENLLEPTITGVVAVGTTLTCHPGSWTANETSVGYRWRVDVLNQAGDVAHLDTTGSTYTPQGREVGQMYCLVDATSRAGVATAVAMVKVPTTPHLLSTQPQPRILGIEISIFQTAPLPAPGTEVTCQPPSYSDPGVTITTRWTRTPSGAAPVDLGTGASLTLTVGLLRAIAGQALGCTTSASIGGFFPDVRSSRDQSMAALYPPLLASVTISPDLYQHPPTAGTDLTCTALNQAGPAEQTSYTWALQGTDPSTVGDAALDADARPLGHDPTYRMTQQDVDDYDAGQYLVCRVEASSWQGTDAWWDWYQGGAGG
jgi:trypsin